MTQISNPIQALSTVLIKPNPVFHTLATVNNWSWFPFLLVNALTMFSMYYYFQVVDFEWYIDLLVNQAMSNNSPAEQELFRENISGITRFQIYSIPIGGAIINAIFAVYLHSMTRNDESNTQGFTDWYGAIWWTQLPSIINSLFAILLLLLASSGQVSPNYMTPLSLAFIFGTELSSSWYTFLGSMRLETIWSIYLTTCCISQWTSFDTRKASIIAIAPYVLIFGIWTLYLVF